MSLTRNPLSPTISIGLSPVCLLISIFSDNGILAEVIKISAFWFVGGCIPLAS